MLREKPEPGLNEPVAPIPVGGRAFDTGDLLEARALECVRDDRVLFTDLSFSLAGGEMLQVEGRNGSGKTSLLRIVCGLRQADEGEIQWLGQSIGDLGSDYHGQIAYLGHQDGVKRELTPVENLRISRAFGKPRHDVEPEDALDQFGLYGFEDVPVRTLSAGQQRRVALARLLVTEARLWVLDEPYTALDRHGIGVVEKILHRHIRNGGMVALTTHHTISMKDTCVVHLNLSA